ncbi:MAG: sugar transporter [Neisseria sp.]|nr:sugar transporter [Neisseria sp.]
MSETEQAQEKVSESRAWLGVLALAFGAFVFNTTEFIPIALLSDIGSSFALSSTETGIMITVYAWIVALMSLPLMLLTRQMERRRLLLLLFAVFVAGHIVSVAANNFALLLAGRVLIALTHAVFWSITAALAIRIAPVGKGNKALSLLSLGSVSAMVLGLPLGRLLGGMYGWRITFAAIAVLALLIALVLAKTLPRLPSVNSGSLASLPVLLRNQTLLKLYAFTVLLVTAHFAAYSYIEPFVREVAQFSAHQITILLTLYGVAGFAGPYLFGRFFEQHGKSVFLLAVLTIMLAMLTLQPLSLSVWAIYAINIAWGAAFMAICLAMVARVLRLAANATDVANAIYSALFNVGIGGGALLGHYAVLVLGLAALGWFGGVLAAIALLLAWHLVQQTEFQ